MTSPSDPPSSRPRRRPPVDPRRSAASRRSGGGHGRGVRRVIGQVLRGFAVFVIGATAAYFAYALVATAADEALSTGERAAIAATLALGIGVCLLMLALRLDDAVLDGALAKRGLTGRLYVALMVCAVLMLLVALLGGTARLGAMAVLIFPAAVAFGLLGTMAETGSS